MSSRVAHRTTLCIVEHPDRPGIPPICKMLERRRALRQLQSERLAPEELLAMLDRGDAVTVVDVRSGLIVDAEPVRIPGALSITLEQIDAHAHRLPKDGVLVTYCACPNWQQPE